MAKTVIHIKSEPIFDFDWETYWTYAEKEGDFLAFCDTDLGIDGTHRWVRIEAVDVVPLSPSNVYCAICYEKYEEWKIVKELNQLNEANL
jgi:hypothetical protein